MSAITPFVKLEVISAEESTASPQPAQLLAAPATYGAPDLARTRPVVKVQPSVVVPASGGFPRPRDACALDDGDTYSLDGTYRKRGRPRKYEGLDEEERRKRRM